MRHSRAWLLGFVALAGMGLGAAIPFGCSAAPVGNTGGTGTGGGTGGVTSSAGTGAAAGEGGIFNVDGGPDADEDATVNPCSTQCGPTELCDPEHVGLDDDCDGQVDEVCDCNAGEAHSCFKGDPSFVGTPGCYPGTMNCTENGTWASCLGGVHATDADKCFLNDTSTCHAMSVVPFQDVNLIDGTGSFSVGADPATELWTVECPPGVSPCPAVGGMVPADDFKPLQSGEYTVTYTKGLPGGGTASCKYPLLVGAPGLRVELSWEHDLGGDGVDLDLHLHQPKNTESWGFGGENQDCTWANCTVEQYKLSVGGADWFDGVSPPDPVDWFLDPVFERNTCYFAPRGKGMEWQALAKGCHNPRLDLDNVSCDPLILDVDDAAFCAPENANIDYPPLGQWTRLGVHYFSNNGHDYDIHPRVKVFCDGALAADLGPAGYYQPEAPVTFAPTDGTGTEGHAFWLVADIAFKAGKCGTKSCIVKPLYVDAVSKAPLVTIDFAADVAFGPPYPPSP
ncbi:MAG: putative metal-binding motif-containing protein [Polyangiaceae bacterium]|nr:putative metal-binding motif-containing protein [Polyangiaceae bacterium]